MHTGLESDDIIPIPYGGFCLRGPNLCELCEISHGLAHFNSTVILSTQLFLACYSSVSCCDQSVDI